MTNKPRVRVGIVSWNTSALLDRCLASLPDALDDVDGSVVVVDNASSDDSLMVAGRHPFVEVIANPVNVGYARAVNQALGGSGADVLIALNPDTVCPAGSLAQLTHRLLDRPEVGLVAPRLTNEDGSLQHSAYTFPSAPQAAAVSFLPLRWQRGRIGRHFWLVGAASHDQPAEIEWAIGAVHVMRAEAVDPAKPYNERWFMYVEDIDLCWRIRRAGWKIRLEGDISVMHTGAASAEQAWGEDRFQRFMPPSYDWFAETHGKLAMRWWATVNTAGMGARILVLALGGLMRRPGAKARAAALSRQWPLHARSILRRPRLPSNAPDQMAGQLPEALRRSASDRCPRDGQAGRKEASTKAKG